MAQKELKSKAKEERKKIYWKGVIPNVNCNCVYNAVLSSVWVIVFLFGFIEFMYILFIYVHIYIYFILL